ncbi:MAG: hypothetical protein Q4C41_09955 [Eggerthellaceae bacterium]|nr:hypothetical protein [Eggerthellaceae bacterium]
MNDVEFLQESVCDGLVRLLVEKRGTSVPEAFSRLQATKTLSLVMDEETGLYRESPAYVYTILAEELGFSAGIA